MTFLRDIKFAFRSLLNTRGLAITVVITLALSIGANAAIFTLVRGVLLRPLANRDEDRLIYIRQSARGLGIDNTTFSVPEIMDLRRFFDNRLHAGWTGRAARGTRGRGRRVVFRGHGFVSSAWEASRAAERPECESQLSPNRLPGDLLSSADAPLAARLIASMLPAMRAARVDVMQALRSE